MHEGAEPPKQSSLWLLRSMERSSHLHSVSMTAAALLETSLICALQSNIAMLGQLKWEVHSKRTRKDLAHSVDYTLHVSMT